ncbi:MAG: MBL fold metallo-hydrolase [Candidatus Aminicenantes bacterium]|nr:MBL fold metallo-hydrolase [Candidatus Aminicenantes bacterium]
MRRGLIYSAIFIISLYGSSFSLSERYSPVDIDSSTVPSEKQESVEKPGLGNPEVHKLQDNVLAITGLYHSSGGGSGTNAGIIFAKNSVIFIDSGMSIASGEFLWKTAQEKMKGNENLYLILTHHHSDHVFGMRVMEEKSAQVIAHKLVEGEFIEMDGEQYKRFLVERSGWSKEQGDLIFGDVVLSQPDVLIEKDTVLNIDGEEVHILVTPGHVPDELSVYHPGSRTLFAGDAIYEGSRLTTRFGGPEEWKLWISHLERFKKLDIATVVPGHGKLCSREEIDRNISYLKEVLAKK